MGRKVKINFYGYEYQVSVGGAHPREGHHPIMPAADNWGWRFGHYREDGQGRLLYLAHPLCGHPNTLAEDIDWMRDHPRPQLEEIYDQVDLSREDPGAKFTLIKTLYHVKLLEALAALLAIYKGK